MLPLNNDIIILSQTITEHKFGDDFFLPLYTNKNTNDYQLLLFSHFRNIRGISQEILGQLADINSATIKKYEYEIRNPKPEQLLKIANALGISINVFMDFDIETVSDVLSLMFQMDEQLDLKWEAKKDSEGNYKPSTLKLSFDNNTINSRLCKYLAARDLLDKVLFDADSYSSEDEHETTIKEIMNDLEEIKNHLLDNNLVVKEGTSGITVKNT